MIKAKRRLGFMAKEISYTLLHVESFDTNYFSILTKHKIEYKTQESVIINPNPFSFDIIIKESDIFLFFCILQTCNTPIKVYTYIDQSFNELDIQEIIIFFLLERKKQFPTCNLKPQILKLYNQNDEAKTIHFIPYLEDWLIYYDAKLPYARLFSKQSLLKGVAFIINYLHPENDLELSVEKTLTDYFNGPIFKRAKEKNKA